MGEAIYYMKAVYSTEKIAEEKKPEVEAFLLRMNQCETMWHDVRSWEDYIKADHILRGKFLDVFEGLGIEKGDAKLDREYQKGLNYLAGLLDSPMRNSEWGLYACNVVGNSIQFWGEVWHFANWDGLKKYLIKGGAIKADWLSEEHTNVNYFDLIGV